MSMGLKRKASFEDSLSPPSSNTPPTSQPPSSDDSIQRLDPAEPQSEPRLNTWNIAGAPYFNSRTRKRFRDNRPSDETIHSRTLHKLYSAQQKNPQQGPQTSPSPPPDLSSHHLRYPATASLTAGPPAQISIPREPAQRSLDAFFPGSRSSASTSAVLQPPLPSSIYQPDETAPTLVPRHAPTLPSILTCEDCYAPLLTKTTGQAIDAEMLDVDALNSLVDAEVGEGWECNMCGKQVCDTCAVRGNYRVCLECAVPGGGRYEEGELRQKRWVGGIGWM